jgi:hypothetical protein
MENETLRGKETTQALPRIKDFLRMTGVGGSLLTLEKKRR